MPAGHELWGRFQKNSAMLVLPRLKPNMGKKRLGVPGRGSLPPDYRHPSQWPAQTTVPSWAFQAPPQPSHGQFWFLGQVQLYWCGGPGQQGYGTKGYVKYLGVGVWGLEFVCRVIAVGAKCIIL